MDDAVSVFQRPREGEPASEFHVAEGRPTGRRTPVDDPVGDPDEAAYKWLNVAADFGHDEAEDMVDAFHQGPLHADDDNLVSGHAHFELAVAYLTGRDGLPVDFGKARGHLKEMAVRNYPYTVQDGKAMLAEARRDMNPEAGTVFDAALAGASTPDVDGTNAE